MSHSEPLDDSTGANWVSVAAAAAVLGVSARAVQKRAARGTLKARKIDQGGAAVWEIDGRELDANMDAATNPDGREHANLSGELGANSEPFHPQTGREPVRQMDAATNANPRTNGREPDANREADFREEIKFLRGLVEQRDRDAAELRASLREALKAMPKALPEGTPEVAPEATTATTKRANEGLGGAAADEAGNGEVSSYGALADWLENQME